MIRVSVQREDFDTGAELGALQAHAGEAGAIASFTGIVRGESHGEKLLSMTLEHFPGMTSRELERIAGLAMQRWPLQGVVVIHRHGELRPGDRIVLVATASAHRHAAFEACAFLMDFLKTQAPFWKLEKRESGAYWVEARDSDGEAAARWARD